VLSADVIARYYRLKGDAVVFVSGSDEHGTPVEVEAVRRGVEPRQLTDLNHARIVDLWRKYGITFDNYTRTESETHTKFVKEFYSRIYDSGYIFSKEATLPFCPCCGRFLPDRFVEGLCPHCGAEEARGDQCPSCGHLLDPEELLDFYCTICKSTPEMKTTKHWYFDLPRFSDQLCQFITNNKRVSPNAKQFSLNIIKEGLIPRPLTRDSEWGIAAPFPGAEKKTIYVWFEAILGYISATIEHFKESGEEDEWKEYWLKKEARTFYFIVKDNIPFHLIILPALLMAAKEDYNLPWTVSSTEFLQFKGERFSKSRKVGIWIDEALELFPPDYWRYFLISTRPETKDTDFSWEIFIERVNADLNDTLGNFIHRTLTFVDQHFGGEVPSIDEIDAEGRAALQQVEKKVEDAALNLEECRLQAALRDIIDIGRIGNRFLNSREPWNLIKTKEDEAAAALDVAIQCVKALSVTLEPFLPFTAKEIARLLNLSGKENAPRWSEATQPLPRNHRIEKPWPLFTKIRDGADQLQDKLDGADR
jgi:methionyl-tRNA synthetase